MTAPTQTATRFLQGELAEEARNFLQLLARHDAGEDVDGELYASIFHLGTHGTLLVEQMDADAFAADAHDDQRAS